MTVMRVAKMYINGREVATVKNATFDPVDDEVVAEVRHRPETISFEVKGAAIDFDALFPIDQIAIARQADREARCGEVDFKLVRKLGLGAVLALKLRDLAPGPGARAKRRHLRIALRRTIRTTSKLYSLHETIERMYACPTSPKRPPNPHRVTFRRA